MTKHTGFRVIMAALAVAFFGGGAGAATVGFDDGKPKKGEAYVEAGFAFDDARIVNGNCMKGACAALNKKERMVMTLESGDRFDLNQISFSFLGGSSTKTGKAGNTLTLTADNAATISFSIADFGKKRFHTVAFDDGFFAGVRSLVFTSSNGGNVRLDAFAAAASAPMPSVPLPASAWLLLGALGGLGFMRRRRAA
ncbi:VPLPA-CTERM sorting domain-containing protein [Pikeienuella piscinae]|uniref:VPLPA-CTERM sorting domain-containing protein n=1 Tax=Pikeienuella piscinae TaxID=2748098 RepID=A0A7L5BYN3_9RHOB|nr:VPLPA-CTERM sorting domain-containing protein [Pikeienuella piscinae]QIE56852.1 VPLPA-CTERM sorting domain-containing protein [Pikeienuella piscinae]